MLSLFSGEREVLEANDLASSPEMADTLLGTAAVYKEMKRPYAAEPLVRRALDVYRQVHGQSSPQVTAALNLLGTLHSQLQDPEGAERQFRKALKLRDGEEDDEAIGAVLFTSP